MDRKNELGDKGEELAAEFLVKNGYKILETNWFYNHKEIDIIAEHPGDAVVQHNPLLVIVEVKTRSNKEFDDPVKAVTRKKQRFIINATNAYIEKKDIEHEVRFDIIIVTISGKKVEIEHIDDAFYPLMN